MRWAFAAMLALSLVSMPARAIDLSTQGRSIILRGDIVEGDGQKFAAYLVDAIQHDKHIIFLVLDSPGGSVSEGHIISNIVRSVQLNTGVPPGGECVSECVEIFSAGMRIIIASDAKVGGHRVSFVGGKENSVTRKVSRMHAKFLRGFGVPAGIVAKFMATPPGELYYLTPADFAEMGVTVMPGQNIF